MTATELKYKIERAGHDSNYFCRSNMRYFGDTMRNYGVRGPIKIRTNMGETVEAYELYRRHPVKYGLKDSAWFRADTFQKCFPERAS